MNDLISDRTPEGGHTGTIRVAGIILAAGLGSRMGRNKPLLPLDGRPVIAHVIENSLAAGPPALDPLVLVLGFEARKIRQALGRLPISIAINPSYEKGMASSIKTGLSRVAQLENQDSGRPRPCTGALFILGDQPLVPSRVITRLIRASADHPGRILAPSFKGKQGNPVLFDRKFFSDLGLLTGDTRGRDLFQSHASDLRKIEVDTPAICQDLDTWEDFQALCRTRKEEK
ncbi:nucleotidyltransferase family protein [Desulfospira joergensenii]|uniref:nucleotidyltransferase family protein n=1 Tax=Desulfospira joergensenii TaxID=53329 RepID=UPI0003B6E046|nr:nucleotidyltransferase family protein [Desulfospira joergensenii]